MDKSGFEFTGSGRVDRVDTYTTKAGKQIVTVVVQVEGAYPKLVPIKFWGRTADDAAQLKKGDVIDASGHLGGREWSGKVYGDIEGERFDVIVEGKQTELPGATPDKPAEDPGSIPF